ncbi:roundabout homolog 2-like isoform X2 [Symsagittifera roscoffensis]|uniref:roundabout homolog 2-like isoform X2 n=1 Tax=Symsagittifera roscoffensis TaxID=84072 RepID=UPI00307B6C2D
MKINLARSVVSAMLVLSLSGLTSGAPYSSSGSDLLLSWPKNQTVKLGSKVTLKCAADARDTEVDWFHNGNKIAHWEQEWQQETVIEAGKSVKAVSVHVLSFSAQVEPIKTTGIYGCTLTNSKGTQWKSDNSSVDISTNENFVKVPEDKTVLWGEIATLSCQLKTSFQRGGSTTRWFHNGVQIDVSADSRISSDQFGLQIRNVEPRDEGSYFCVASKPGSDNFNSSNGFIKVVYPPRVDMNGVMVQTGFVSQSVVLSCPMIGQPRVSCYWSRVGGTEIPATRAMQTDNRLAIGHVQSSDQGEYMCQCHNEYGENRVVIKLQVPTILEFATKPVDTVALIGHSVHIPCLVSSTVGHEHGVTIVWERKERPSDLIFQGETLENKEVLQNGTLILRNVTADDRGYYICKALQPTANAQQIDETIFVEVRSHSNLRPPIITIAPFNHSMQVGGRLRLPCAASSESAVTITWRFVNEAWNAIGNTRTRDNRINTENNGALVVSDVRHEDSGMYKCIASTSQGTTERYAVITVKKDGLKESPSPKKLPMPVGKPIITHVTQDSVTLVWYPGENQSPEYAVEMYSYETHVFAWHTVGDRAVSPKLMIGQLAAHEDYEFLVRGVNNLGFGLPSPVSSRIRTVERNTDAAMTGIRPDDIKPQIELVEVEALEGTAVNSTSAWIQWNVLHNSYFVQGFTIKYAEHDGGNNFQPQNYKVIEVNDPYARAMLVTSLDPWSSYMASIQPYYESVPGLDSAPIFFTTPEGTPRDVVDNIILKLMSGGRYLVTWSEPKRQREGHVVGYSVALYFGDSDTPLQTLNTSETQCTFTIVEQQNDFRVSIAARTKAGVGVFSPLVAPKAGGGTTDGTSWIVAHPWVLAIAGAIVWIALAIISVLIWRRNKKGHYKSVNVKLEQSLQPPSEYAGGQWQVILPASAQRNLTLMNGSYMGPGPSGTLCPQPTMATSQGMEMNHFMGGTMAMNTMPMSMKNGNSSNYAAQPECYQPLVVNIAGQKNPNEGVYQCGDCYEECQSMPQCNNNPHSHHGPSHPSSQNNEPHPSNSCTATPYTCNQGDHRDPPTHLGIVYHPNSSPPDYQPYQSQSNPPGCKFATNPNRYQPTPPPRSPEHLYNELDQPKQISGAQSLHHYEVYDAELLQQSLANSPSNMQGYHHTQQNPNTPSRNNPAHLHSMMNMPAHLSTSQFNAGPQQAHHQSLTQQSPPTQNRVCPRMGLSGVNNRANNLTNNNICNDNSNQYVNTALNRASGVPMLTTTTNVNLI